MADEIIEEFLAESHEGLSRIERDLVVLEAQPGTSAVIDRVFRDVHTIKGVCGFLGFEHLERLAHAAEELLSALRTGDRYADASVIDGLLRTVDAIRAMLGCVERTESDGDEPYRDLVDRLERLTEGRESGAAPTPIASRSGASAPAERSNEATVEPALDAEIFEASPATFAARGSTIRVSVDLLDRLMNLVGELVLVRNQVLQSTGPGTPPAALAHAQRLNSVTTELQEGLMKTRMQPIGTVWAKFPRVVRDLAQACQKQVRLEMDGRETDLDKTLLEAIHDPLTHLVRNACDHGLEIPEVRVAGGKPAVGVVRLRAFHESGQVIVEVSDDGAGIDPAQLKAKALAKGLITEAQSEGLNDRDALGLVFLPGLSTAEAVTRVSGRGVGMDVVKTNVERIGGTIDLDSTPGEGTTVRVKIPLTLAIIPALIVECAGDRYAIPQANLLELVWLGGEARTRVEHVHTTPVYRLRGELLPLVFLSEQLALGAAWSEPGETHIVVLEADGQRFGLVVGEVRDTEEIVVKPLGPELGGLSVYAGATIMGDGSVALILDVSGLLELAGFNLRDPLEPSLAKSSSPVDRALDDAQTLLLFDAGGTARVALPLARIDRLEEFEPTQIERVGPRDVVRYRDQIMPVVFVAHELLGHSPDAVRTVGANGRHQVVVIRRADQLWGLVVRELVDIVDAQVTVRSAGRRFGVLGTCIVQDEVVELLDVDAVLAQAVPELGPASVIGEGG